MARWRLQGFCCLLLIVVFFKTAAAHTYYLPHVVSKTGIWSAVSLRSYKGGAHVNIQNMSPTGKPLKSEAVFIDPDEQKVIVLGDDRFEKGWAEINSDRPLSGACFLGMSGNGSLMVTWPLTSTLSKSFDVPFFAQSPVWDTEIYLANPNQCPATVKLKGVAPDGGVSFSKTLNITPRGSIEFSGSEWVPDNKRATGSIQILSNQGIAVLAVLHNLKSGAMGFTVLPVTKLGHHEKNLPIP